MKHIQLKSRVHFICPLKSGWAASMFAFGDSLKYAIIDSEGEAEYYDGYIIEGTYELKQKIMVKDRKEKKTGYLDEFGNLTQEKIECISDLQDVYRFKQIDRGCLFNELFEIETGNIGFLISSKEKKFFVVKIPNVFSSDYYLRMAVTEDNRILVYQPGNNNIVLMDNPAK